MTVEEILSLLKEKGYKYTGKREDMIRILDRERRYLSAKELIQYMQKDYPTLSFDTVYRNLSLFKEIGVVEETELNGERIYRLHCSTNEHHHHLICLKCGKARYINFCPMEGMLANPNDFVITGHKFEIYGYCLECSALQNM